LQLAKSFSEDSRGCNRSYVNYLVDDSGALSTESDSGARSHRRARNMAIARAWTVGDNQGWVGGGVRGESQPDFFERGSPEIEIRLVLPIG
jgi:hypothetical protein